MVALEARLNASEGMVEELRRENAGKLHGAYTVGLQLHMLVMAVGLLANQCFVFFLHCRMRL